MQSRLVSAEFSKKCIQLMHNVIHMVVENLFILVFSISIHLLMPALRCRSLLTGIGTRKKFKG